MLLTQEKPVHEKVDFLEDSLVRYYDTSHNHSYPMHVHSAMEIIMPLTEQQMVTTAHAVYRLKPGDILILQPNTSHALSSATGRRVVFLVSLLPIVSQRMYRTVCASLPGEFLVRQNSADPLHQGLYELMREIGRESADTRRTTELSVYARVLQMLTLISEYQEATLREEKLEDAAWQQCPNGFQTICTYIHEHFMDKLTLEETAQVCGFSKFYFERLFKQHMNVTFYQYLSGVRLKHAAQLLGDSALPITTVSLQSGFTSLSAFIRMFRQHYGCTPSDYRGSRQKLFAASF